jgi:hypothetical protein
MWRVQKALLLAAVIVGVAESKWWWPFGGDEKKMKKKQLERVKRGAFYRVMKSLGDTVKFEDGRLKQAVANFRSNFKSPFNVLSEFDADWDVILGVVVGIASVDRVGLTARNVSLSTVDHGTLFPDSHEWEHALFPGVVTKGFDPTHVPTDLLFVSENEVMNKLFQTDKGLSVVAQSAFANIDEGGLRFEPEEQGVWTVVPSDTLSKRHSLRTDTNLPHRHARAQEILSNGKARAAIDLRELYLWPEDAFDDDPGDKAMAQFYFAGIGQVLLQRVEIVAEKQEEECRQNKGVQCTTKAQAGDAVYVAPLDYLSTFAVKDGAGKYGGDVYFDAGGKLLHIVYDSKKHEAPADESSNPAAWSSLKRHCRGTAVMYLTLVDHLLGVHLHYSNSIANSAPLLPPTHPVRQLLWPHVFNALGVNRKAAISLSLPGGLFARGWALENATALYDHVARTNPLFEWMPVQERFDLQGIPELPFQVDGRDFYDVVRKYVQRYVDGHFATDHDVAADQDLNGHFAKSMRRHSVLFSRENVDDKLPDRYSTKKVLVDVLAAYIFYVTGYHTQVGSIHHEATRPDIAPSSWYEQPDEQDGAPPNAFFWATATFYFTADLRLSLVGDPCSTQQTCGFADKLDYQSPLPRDALTQPEITPRGYPELFADQPSKKISRAFAGDLLDLQKRVIKRNKDRFACDDEHFPTNKALCRPYNTFDINYIELSVGI